MRLVVCAGVCVCVLVSAVNGVPVPGPRGIRTFYCAAERGEEVGLRDGKAVCY